MPLKTASRPLAVFSVVAALTLLVDQSTKALVRANLQLSESIPLLEGVFHLTYLKNPGAAFGLMPGALSLFIATYVIVIAGTVLFWAKARPTTIWVVVALALFTAGATGNFIDRVSVGKVTDFLDFTLVDWPIFNVADVGIVVGILLLVLWVLFDSPQTASQKAAGESDARMDSGT